MRLVNHLEPAADVVGMNVVATVEGGVSQIGERAFSFHFAHFECDVQASRFDILLGKLAIGEVVERRIVDLFLQISSDWELELLQGALRVLMAGVQEI